MLRNPLPIPSMMARPMPPQSTDCHRLTIAAIMSLKMRVSVDFQSRTMFCNVCPAPSKSPVNTCRNTSATLSSVRKIIDQKSAIQPKYLCTLATIAAPCCSQNAATALSVFSTICCIRGMFRSIQPLMKLRFWSTNLRTTPPTASNICAPRSIAGPRTERSISPLVPIAL